MAGTSSVGPGGTSTAYSSDSAAHARRELAVGVTHRTTRSVKATKPVLIRSVIAEKSSDALTRICASRFDRPSEAMFIERDRSIATTRSSSRSAYICRTNG